jgi:predicted DsbA family dithiol-disulfide isomerase
MTLTVDVISDVICPWCYLGKRRLEMATAGFDVRVRWLPFQLNPQMPKEGISRKEYRTAKFRNWERSLELDAKMVAIGEAEGIRFAFDKIERTPNTLDAHRLIWLADKQGIQDAVVEALFLAYFTEGQDISNRRTLLGWKKSRRLSVLEWTVCLSSSSTAKPRCPVRSRQMFLSLHSVGRWVRSRKAEQDRHSRIGPSIPNFLSALDDSPIAVLRDHMHVDPIRREPFGIANRLLVFEDRWPDDKPVVGKPATRASLD